MTFDCSVCQLTILVPFHLVVYTPLRLRIYLHLIFEESLIASRMVTYTPLSIWNQCPKLLMILNDLLKIIFLQKYLNALNSKLRELYVILPLMQVNLLLKMFLPCLYLLVSKKLTVICLSLNCWLKKRSDQFWSRSVEL